MNSYELIVVFKQDIGEAAIKEEASKIKTLISNQGGVSVEVAAWGRKEIPYIASRMASGFFYAFTFQSPKSETVAEVEGILRITESVEKFQTHKTSIAQRKFKGNPKSKYTGEEDDFDVENEYM